MFRLCIPVTLFLAAQCLASAQAQTQEVHATLNASAATDIPPAATAAPAVTALKERQEPVQKEKKAVAKNETNALASRAPARRGIDRVVFHRVPVKVLLEPGRERLLHFPNPVTLHAPPDVNSALQSLDIIDRTIYVTAQMPFPRMRVVAEDLVTGRMIPIDLEANTDGRLVADELEIFVAADSKGARAESRGDEDAGTADPVDIVTLTRYAARMIYAPRRLIPQSPGIRQVRVAARPVAGLYRSTAAIETTPIGAWRSQDLYVTAVKFVNRSKTPVDIDLDEMRGRWVAATAQHGRLLAAGSDEDTTVVYLVSERPFEESR